MRAGKRRFANVSMMKGRLLAFLRTPSRCRGTKNGRVGEGESSVDKQDGNSETGKPLRTAMIGCQEEGRNVDKRKKLEDRDRDASAEAGEQIAASHQKKD